MKKKILLVDDDNIFRSTLSGSLTDGNFNIEVIDAKDPIDAIDKFHQFKDSLTHVVVDYYMPIENGLEFCKLVKSSSPNIIVILFSGDVDLERTLKSGFVDKFFRKDRPKQLVNYLLDQES